jgi:hypothetical protein
MRFLSLFALLLVPLIAQAPRVDLIHLDPQPAISGGCPARVHFTGRIRAKGPLEVVKIFMQRDCSSGVSRRGVARVRTFDCGATP